jgi:hypothetical protein
MTWRSLDFAVLRAMLWENWRMTRVEVAWRLVLGIVGGLTVLAVFSSHREVVKDFSAAIALILIVLPHFVGWLSMAKLSSGRPGFPLYLLYTRPVRTAVLVGIPMAYLTVLPAAIYLVSALLLRATSGYAFPLLSVAAWIAALNLVLVATNWSARNRLIQMLVVMAATSAWLNLAIHRLTAVEIQGSYDWPPNLWPTLFDFPLTDYALIGAIGLASFGLAVASVARQRHGDAPAAMRRTMEFPGFPERLINLFRFPCPTSSATRAQVWFELKSSGLPLLAVGLVLAILNLLVFAITHLTEFASPFAVMFAMASVLAVLILTFNAFGMRWRQGRWYASAFEATQPYGTAQLAGLKVLVRSVCVLPALFAVVLSAWASLSFIVVGERYLRSGLRVMEVAVGALTGYQQFALAVVASIGVVVMVAWIAATIALAARYPRPLNIASCLYLLSWSVVLALLALAGYRGLGLLFGPTRFIDAPALVLATAYLSWKAFEERLLTLRSACGVVLVSVAFGAAWVTALRAAGVQLGAIPTMDAVWMLSPVLLPLMASTLAPWSLSRIRHT